MIVVIFEVQFYQEKAEDYFKLAHQLRADLEQMDGFISGERFESIATSGKYVSISYWRDLDAVKQWRNHIDHRKAQTEGRSGIISNYRLRVANILRDYTLLDATQAPEDSLAYFE